MIAVFAFEREIYETLEFLPMEVRRELDLGRLKLSLAAWQALSFDIPQTAESHDDLAKHLTSIRQIEAATKLDFFPLFDRPTQDALETPVSPALWPTTE